MSYLQGLESVSLTYSMGMGEGTGKPTHITIVQYYGIPHMTRGVSLKLHTTHPVLTPHEIITFITQMI